MIQADYRQSMRHFRQYLIEFRSYPTWLKALLPLSGTLLITSLITQMVLFPDHPIVPHHGGYIGKYGAVHTREGYELSTWINRAILLAGLTFFAAFFSTLFYAKQDLGHRDQSPTSAQGSERDTE